MEVIGNRIIFSTGREEYANGGIIGISSDCLRVTEGYDTELHAPHEDWMDDGYCQTLTLAEQIELADHMIERWKAFLGRAEAMGANG